jgi:nitrile hydratase accessory protein
VTRGAPTRRRVAMADDAVLPDDGPAAPPRSNGELVFAAPWESRLFGMTMSLQEAGLFEWRDFQRELVAQIAAWEKAGEDRPYLYYEQWRVALERLLDRLGACRAEDLEKRARALSQRPHDHDHRHDPPEPE